MGTKFHSTPLQAEKTSAKLNNTNPKWEETMCIFVTDAALNDELSITVHQDDVSRLVLVRGLILKNGII